MLDATVLSKPGEVKQRSAGSVNHRGGVLPAVPVTGLKEESHDGILTQKELGVGTGPAHLCIRWIVRPLCAINC